MGFFKSKEELKQQTIRFLNEQLEVARANFNVADDIGKSQWQDRIVRLEQEIEKAKGSN